MFRLALNNCFRNTRRTVTTALSVFIASLIVIVVMSFMYTVMADMMNNEKLYSLGDLRIRNSDYTRYESLMPVQFYVDDVKNTEKMILSQEGVESAVMVSRVYASLYRDGKTETVAVIGASGNSVFFSDAALLSRGRLPDASESEALATVRFLSEFNLDVGDSVILLFRTVSSGSNAVKVTISGEVSYMNAEYNSSMLIMPSETVSAVTHMDDGALEMLVYISDGYDSASVKASLDAMLNSRNLEVSRYESISTLESMKMVYTIMIDLIVVLFFFIASTLVFNTMMMSVLERRKEIATLVALGFSRGSVMLLFVLEGVIISSFGAVAASLAGKAVITYFYHAGLDLTLFGADAVEGWSFPKRLYTTLSADKYFIVIIIETAVSAAAAYFASRRIRKMEVAEELREEA